VVRRLGGRPPLADTEALVAERGGDQIGHKRLVCS
jgi:hypothetical protein